MAVFAHPDDESFCCGGTLALMAERGVRVVVVCATRGEAGSSAVKLDQPIHEARALELCHACTALGIEQPVFLDFHDSGFHTPRLDDPLALINADPLEVESRILDAIAWFGPQVVVGFDPHGGYGHPDHVVMHRAVTAAFHSSAGLLYAPERLFYTVTSPALLERFGSAGFGTLDRELYTVPDASVAIRYVLDGVLWRKYAALRAHASQSAPGSGIARLLPELEPGEPCPAALEEWFLLGGARGPIPRWPLPDFFDGMTTTTSSVHT
jgi:N-acetyl-1-D-myo-inositol-2-amino-2-deoxy-alpha-D-glucopyranoside deacetylase